MKRLLLLALPALLAGCPKPKTADETATPPAKPAESAVPADAAAGLPKVEFKNAGMIRTAGTLPKYQWRLAAATDAKGHAIDALLVRPGQPVTLGFNGGKLVVGNTCNAMTGGYRLDGKGITIDKLASTMKACADPKLMALDQEVGKRLQGVLEPRLSKGDARQLQLKTAAGDLLVFTSAETAASKYGAGERVFLEVAAQTKPCNHPLIPGKQCLQVRELKYDDKGLKSGTPGAFRNFYDGIEGYTHQAGVRNVLRIDRYTRKDVPADASRYVYVLDQVVESDASGK